MFAAAEVLPRKMELPEELREESDGNVRTAELETIRAGDLVRRVAIAIGSRPVERAIAASARPHDVLQLSQAQANLIVSQVSEYRMADGEVELHSKRFECKVRIEQQGCLFRDACLFKKFAAYLEVRGHGVNAEIPPIIEVRQ
jgi:hypothetical protein